MLDQNLLKYIPKEYKSLVVDIYEGEKEWNEYTNRWNTELVVEWANGETSYFQNKGYAKFILKDQHSPEEFE